MSFKVSHGFTVNLTMCEKTYPENAVFGVIIKVVNEFPKSVIISGRKVTVNLYPSDLMKFVTDDCVSIEDFKDYIRYLLDYSSFELVSRLGSHKISCVPWTERIVDCDLSNIEQKKQI